MDPSELNWDDLRYVLAVADAGSVNGAARRLSVNHATVLRRIDGVEKQFGHPLFEKNRSGYRPTELGERIVRSAQKIREQVMSLQSGQVDGESPEPSGVVRITTTDSLAHTVLSPLLQSFCDRYPNVSVHLNASNHHIPIEDHRADIAVRPTREPPERVVATAVSPIGLGLYVPTDWPVSSVSEIDASANWLVLTRSVPSPTHFWMETNFPSARVSFSGESFVLLSHLATQANAAVVLPCCLGDTNEALKRVGRPLQEIGLTLYVLSPADLLAQPGVKRLYDALVTGLSGLRRQIAGQ